MKRLLSLILCIVGVCALRAESTPHTMRVECGSWFTLSAQSYDDYHFVEWNDHNTDAVRQIQVNEDATYVAFFAANCEEYANWPLVALYDWLLMLNVQAINDMGYYISPAAVTWYRVVGPPDDMHNAFPQDDVPVATGYYLTLAQNLQGTGDYYAVADVSDARGMLCDGLMRSTIAHYAHSGQRHQVALNPNQALAGETLRIVGLDPAEQTTIRVYSTTGQLLATYTSVGADTYLLQAAYVAGCYQVRVESPSLNETLRYIVKK